MNIVSDTAWFRWSPEEVTLFWAGIETFMVLYFLLSMYLFILLFTVSQIVHLDLIFKIDC